MNDGAPIFPLRKEVRGTGGRAVIQSCLNAGKASYHSRADTQEGCSLRSTGTDEPSWFPARPPTIV